MKKKITAGLLAVVLIAGMVAGSLWTAGGTWTVRAEEPAAQPADRTWDLASDSVATRPTLERNTGEYDGIQIDAVSGKFAPRDTDTQINAGTVLTIPVAANAYGAVLTFDLSGGSAAVQVGETEYGSANNKVEITLEAVAADTVCEVVFTAGAYISKITLSYKGAPEVYPGVPESVQAADVSYTFASAEGLLGADGVAPANATLEGIRGTFADIKVDATAAGSKFAVQPANSRVQINAGTVLYIPAAYDVAGPYS